MRFLYRMEGIAGTSKEESGAIGNSKSETNPGGQFKCHICSLDEKYDYFGSEPPFAKHLIYQEKCYIKRDPFSALNKGEVLPLGGDCSFCKSQVCMNCSLFYTKRLCAVCCNKVKNNLPQPMHTRIKKISENLYSKEKDS